MATCHSPLFAHTPMENGMFLITIGISIFIFNQRTRKYGEAS
jgi:hypothetical protein